MGLNKDVLFVLVATLGLSLKGIWARLAYAEGLDVAGVIFYRSMLATPLFLLVGPLMLWRQSSLSDAPASAKPRWRTWGIAVTIGSLFSVGMYTDFQAIAYLGAGVSRVILFGFPLVVMAIETIQHARFPARHRLLGFAVAWIGLLFVAAGADEVAALDWRAGLIWGFASLLLYGFFVAASAPLSQQLGSIPLTIVSNTATGVVIVSVSLAQTAGELPQISSPALVWIGAMVVVSTVVPYFLLTEGIRRLGGSQAGLIGMLGPPLTVGVGYVVLDERLGVFQILGAFAVLVGVFLATRSSQRYSTPKRFSEEKAA